MSAVTESRARQLDSVLDQAGVDETTGGELFDAIDVLNQASGLRRALSDPAATSEAKVALVDRLFGSRLSARAVTVLKEAASVRWSSTGALRAAIERQAVRAELKQAEAAGELDRVSEDLFSFTSTVATNNELQDALTNPRVGLSARQALVERLLSGKTSPVVIKLVQRALASRSSQVAGVIEGYGLVAAQLRDRGVAKVTTAAPLSEEQDARLRAALAKQVGRRVDLQVTVDPTVLGGMRVRLGDDVIEGTVARRLEDARRQLA